VFAAAAVALAGGLALAGSAAPAMAVQQQICGNLGSGYCLNDWNNQGSGFRSMYYGGNPNENFTAQFINRCGGHAT
jgi:hypothetical protein